ncbi:MAG: IS110 family transposase [Actinomycetota bacterium]|nr:IS110 family transposase [Actinomycetota bacterium]
MGIDLHRHRSVIVRRSAAGDTLGCVRVSNEDLAAFSAELALAGESPEVVLEATYGWYWAADWLAEHGAKVHLAHPLGNNWGNRRVKNDERDATDLADLLRLGRLAESWVAPPATRELGELVRYRFKLVWLRNGLKSQVYSVLAKEGVHVGVADLFGVAGNRLLDDCHLSDAYRMRVESLRELIAHYDREVRRFSSILEADLARDAGYRAIQEIPGIGPVLAAIFVAEIGDVSRFSSPRQLTCWAGLTPRHRESDTTVHRGPITKQGSSLVRWAAVEAVSRNRGGSVLREHYQALAARRDNKNIARVAMARRLLTLVFYGLRDGEVRCLQQLAS